MDVATVAAVSYNPRFTQRHQVLGESGLAQAKHGFEVADTRLAITDRQQDLQAGFLPNGLEQRGDLLYGGYIRHNEYIVSPPTYSVSAWRHTKISVLSQKYFVKVCILPE